MAFTGGLVSKHKVPWNVVSMTGVRACVCVEGYDDDDGFCVPNK